MMKKIFAYLELIRPINVFITLLVVWVSASICSYETYFSLTILWGSLSAALVAAAGNVINDYYDLEIDKINRPTRPIASGNISRNHALIFYSIIEISALIISFTISVDAFILVSITSLLLFIYSYSLKGVILIGNLTVALCTALAFIFGGVLVTNISNAIIPAVFAFLVNLIRELLKDVEDMDGDKRNNVITFPVEYGIEKSKVLISLLTTVLIITTFIPFLAALYKIEYFVSVLFLVNLPLVYLITEINSNKFVLSLRKISNLLKLIMVFGLLSIIFGI